MGNCCSGTQAEGNAESEIAMRTTIREKNEAGTDILNPSEAGQTLDSAFVLTDFSSHNKLEPPPPPSATKITQPPPTEAEVRFLQAAILVYLSKKSLTSRQSDLFDWDDPPNMQTEQAIETNADPITNLSDPTKQMLARRGKFAFEKDVSGVVSSPARQLPDGSIYIGQWATCDGALTIRKGKGRLYSADGSFSEGYWRSGKLHHKARYITPNGDFYEGGFVDGQKEGTGEYETFDRRMKYTGQWEMDMRHGRGVEEYSDGAKYIGEFRNGEKTGKGRIMYEDGSVYQGDFLSGEFDGFGDYSWADGRHYSGSWKKSKMNGKGKFSYKDGKWYEGDYVNDKKEGFGVYYWDSKTYEGEWKAGKMHGVGWFTNEKGRKKYQFHEGSRGNEIKA